MRHLLSIEDLDRADDRAHLRPRRLVRRGRRPRDQEGPGAARPDRPEPLLRGLAPARARSFELAAKRLSADVVNFAASGLERREGRVAEGHGPDARRPQARRDRHPHARGRAPPRWSPAGRRAAIVNAGDGKHEHPTQALLDVTRCARASAALDGANIWIVGDVLHSRVARSNILAFQKMGAKVTVVRPADADPARDRGAGLRGPLHARRPRASADVVYALRMQNERMDQAWVPSLREYAALLPDQRPPAAARARCSCTPGPVNRGVELSGEVVDSPQAVITAQVEAGRRRPHGRPLRGARRHAPASRAAEPHAAREPAEALRHERRSSRAPAAPRRPARPRRPRARPARAASTRLHDVLVRDGEIAEIGAPGALEAPDGRRGRRRRRAATCFPAFVDPHVHLRTPGQEHKEDLETGTRAAAAGGFCAVVAMPNTDPVVDSRAAAALAARRRRARRAHPRRLHARDHPRPAAARSSPRWPSCATRARSASPTTASRSSAPGMLRKALQYQRLCGGVLALHEEDPSLSGARRDARGRRSARCSASRASRAISESTMVARDAALAGYEGGRVHMQHLSAPRVGRRPSRAPRPRGVQVTCEASPHHLCLTDEAVAALDTRMKMNPPLRTEADRQALIEGLRDGDDRLHRHRPRAARARREGGPVRAGADGHDRAGDRVRRAPHRARRARRSCRWRCVVERMTAGAALLDLPSPRIAPGAPANLVARRPRRASGGRRATATRAARRTAASPAARCAAGPAHRRRRRGRLPRARQLEVVGSEPAAHAAPQPADAARGAGRRRRPGGLPLRTIDASRDVAASVRPLVEGARILGLPVLATEQYPKGLRPHRRPRSGYLDDVERIEKTVFSAARADGFDLAGRDQVLVCGIEAHVCVVADRRSTCSTAASRSRSPPTRSARATRIDREVGLRAAATRAGATLTTVEAALLELLRARGHPRVQGRPEG